MTDNQERVYIQMIHNLRKKVEDYEAEIATQQVNVDNLSKALNTANEKIAALENEAKQPENLAADNYEVIEHGE